MIICVSDVEKQRNGRTLRQMCADYGLPESDIAHLSRILTGKPVSIATQRRIGRAIGVLRPARKRYRAEMNTTEFAAWQRMGKSQRRVALGLQCESDSDII